MLPRTETYLLSFVTKGSFRILTCASLVSLRVEPLGIPEVCSNRCHPLGAEMKYGSLMEYSRQPSLLTGLCKLVMIAEEGMRLSLAR